MGLVSKASNPRSKLLGDAFALAWRNAVMHHIKSKRWAPQSAPRVRSRSQGDLDLNCGNNSTRLVKKKTIANFFEKVSKFVRKFIRKKMFCSSLGRPGASGKSRATRCQNSGLLRRLATPNKSKNQFEKNAISFGLGNQFFAIFPGFWRG